jgi:hypothetical protein
MEETQAAPTKNDRTTEEVAMTLTIQHRNSRAIKTAKIQERFSNAKNRHQAALAVTAYVKLQAKMIGADPKNVFLLRTDDERGWQVVWEEGPYEWAVSIAGGATIYGSELGYDSTSRHGDFNTYGKRFYCECQNSCTLVIAE